MPIYSSCNRRGSIRHCCRKKTRVAAKKALPDAADTAVTEAAQSNTQDSIRRRRSDHKLQQRHRHQTPTTLSTNMAEFDADAFADSLPGWDPEARAAFLASLDDDEAPELPLLAESVDEMDPAMVEALMQLRDGGEPPSELAVDAKERGMPCVEIKFRTPHAIDAMLDLREHLLDGIKVDESLR